MAKVIELLVITNTLVQDKALAKSACDGQRATVFAKAVLKAGSFACFSEVYLGQHKM